MSLKNTYLGEYTLYELENSVCYTKLAKVIALNVLVHILNMFGLQMVIVLDLLTVMTF